MTTDGHAPDARPIKDASTVMVIRDADRGPEVFVARRVRGMAFAGGMTVFPGGGVDASDDDPDLAWTGPAPEWWAGKFACDVPRARRLVCAAARETFEECGVLLADHLDGSPVAAAGRYHSSREDLERHRLTFGRFLSEEGLSLAAGRLRPYDHWITPSVEPRRYDTRFFLAALPEGQEPDDLTTEVDLTMWARPVDLLDDFRSGRSMLLPPTWTQLRVLAQFSDVGSALAAEREISPVEPEIIEHRGGVRVGFDGSDEYWSDYQAGHASAES
ncbi:NUDIX hydrolase [Dietzia sp. PP-33]|uniref:NUDIX hydrolase n=1 Tax=Dietzia sp. PP-33 TaxID=2957500 RepID=UPI0029A98BDF|nr:NUDIX hydrolase [Dietzia sp. PP-33]MDX2355321.1 NUDIX hydrolase [Dietzia sp. PP-33]